MAGARAQTEVMLQARALFHLERVALSPARENRRQLVRRDDFELIEGALLRLLVEPPAAKLRCVAKTRPLHMVISDRDHQVGSRTGAPVGRGVPTVPRFQPPPRRTQHADFPHCAPPFASLQGLWDLSYRGNFRSVVSHSIAVEQP